MTNPIFTNEKSIRSLSEFEFLHDPNDKNSKLGVGSFASVKLAKEKKTGKQCAIKIIDMHPSKVTSSDLHNIRTEITIHRKLEHPNIVQFHDYIQKDHNVYLILEFADSGNLYSHIHKRKNHLPPEDVFRFFYQTCLAIQYLHQNDVLHRDIKPENLLLDRSKNIKLCDFGWSTRRITEKRLTFCGTYEYMAPEIVHKKPYDYRVDIWSLGVLLYELIHKEAPYKGRSLPEITKSLEKSHIEFSSRTTPEARDLILKILRTNPNDRLSVAQILSHPYVQTHLSPEEDDSLEIEEVAVVSPRELRPLMNTQSVFCDSPKQKLRRDNENFKSEIIMTSDDGIFAEIMTSKTRKNSHNHLYNSFNMPCSAKNKERSKERSKERTQDREKREKGKFINIAKSLTQGEGLKTSIQDFVMNTKTTEENLSAVRDHVRSSPSLAQKAFDKAGLEEKNIRNNLERKRKIFENTILSPNFKNKVDGIMLQLSSQTTTHKLTDRTPSLFNSKPAQTPSSEVPIGFKYFDENSYFGPSLSSMRTKTDLENSKGLSMRNNSKSNFQKKIAIVKADTFSTLASPIAYPSTLTTRAKVNTRGSDSIDQENFGLAQKLSEGLKSATHKNFANALLNTDQNKFKGQQDRLGSEVLLKKFQKGQDIKKKSLRSEEGSSGSLHISSLSERRNENKESKKSLIKDKENHMKFREEYTGRWEL